MKTQKAPGGLELSGRRPGGEMVRTLAGQRFSRSTPDLLLLFFKPRFFSDPLIKCLRLKVKVET